MYTREEGVAAALGPPADIMKGAPKRATNSSRPFRRIGHAVNVAPPRGCYGISHGIRFVNFNKDRERPRNRNEAAAYDDVGGIIHADGGYTPRGYQFFALVKFILRCERNGDFEL